MTYLSAGTVERESMLLEASFVNANVYSAVTYVFGCVPEDPMNGCPYCPGNNCIFHLNVIFLI